MLNVHFFSKLSTVPRRINNLAIVTLRPATCTLDPTLHARTSRFIPHALRLAPRALCLAPYALNPEP